MSTASTTHHPIPRTTAAAAAVAALAFGALLVAQNIDSGSPSPVHHRVSVPIPNLDANYQRPVHGGVQPSWP